ncbi:DNA repair protein RecN (Recombination protein N) [Hymenobacter luteus]|uniref:DNA repair protein RecN n=2 Tax=Hymenobacter TaxID=89966 RepID=A0A7W9T039_9BACT|nr:MULTISPECIES: DNA repair protein RecN [Hymenobacter]MBB4600661.1 DNA repair protein RecN (Recombination protein N) [Hymenobacter latericoloratus]MBB6059132.1 DNA repair protein RecN (Recombination protein N) [Hymenobacter luteus]
MLVDLRIRNYALIEQLQLQPSALLNIITGETGAGKSIMLGAIGLLLGNRADSRMLFDTEKKCVIEGQFDISSYQLQDIFEAEDLDYDTQCILRREISPAGKSRAFVNDTPVTLDTLRNIGANLMDIHSQHDTLLLGDAVFQLNLLDLYAGLVPTRAQYSNAYRQYRKLEADLKTLEDQVAQANKELDYHSFLLNELEDARLDNEQQDDLEQEVKELEHAEEIKFKLTSALQHLSESEYCATGSMKEAATLLGQIAAYSEQARELKHRLDSCLIELHDIADEIEVVERRTEGDPARIDELQGRLNVLYNLQRKHQVRDVVGLLAVRGDLRDKVGSVLNLDKQIARLRRDAEGALATVKKQASRLSEARRKVFPKFEKELVALLADLGMPNSRIVVQHQEGPPATSGIDVISILFTANKGAQPQTLSKAASGGEFSRLMLCIKYMLADKTALPTIVFDEIDTGISGEIAVKVGRMMQQMARKHQLITISHLPQMAAAGDAHYFVYKEDRADRTVSNIRMLNLEERIHEIAQMISGANPSQHAYQSARELLAMRGEELVG